jgi:hypothetical protein
MPITYTIDLARRLVRLRIWGVLTPDELRDTYARIAADPDFDPCFWQLTDARDLVRVAASAGEVREAAEGRVFTAGTRRAIVASTDYQFGMARMFSSFASGIEQDVQVFRDLAAAEAWLTT